MSRTSRRPARRRLRLRRADHVPALQVHLYTGDGKGKTTAAFGIALRAAGRGLRTSVIQFLKGTPVYGELGASTALGRSIWVFQFGRNCPFLEGSVRSSAAHGASTVGCTNAAPARGCRTRLLLDNPPESPFVKVGLQSFPPFRKGGRGGISFGGCRQSRTTRDRLSSPVGHAVVDLNCRDCSCPCHVSPDTTRTDDRFRVSQGLAAARRQIASGKWDIIVLDESLYLPAIGLCSVADLLRVVQAARAVRKAGAARPIALVLTGGPCPPSLAEAADLVTSITSRKHHWTRHGFSIPGIDR